MLPSLRGQRSNQTGVSVANCLTTATPARLWPCLEFGLIIHCTAKLARKLPKVSPQALSETSPLGSWHAHLYHFHKRQCVLFCHDRSRYALFLSGLRKAEFAALGDWFVDALLTTLEAEGFENTEIAQVAKSLGTIEFDTETDPSVLAAIHSVSQSVKAMLSRGHQLMELEQTRVSLHLSHRPTQVRGEWQWPDKVMAQMVMAIQAGGSSH